MRVESGIEREEGWGGRGAVGLVFDAHRSWKTIEFYYLFIIIWEVDLQNSILCNIAITAFFVLNTFNIIWLYAMHSFHNPYMVWQLIYVCITCMLTYIVFLSMTRGHSSCTNLKYHINTDVRVVLIQLFSLLNQVFSVISSTKWIKVEGYSRVYPHAETYVVLKIETSSVCESACCEGHPGSKSQGHTA